MRRWAFWLGIGSALTLPVPATATPDWEVFVATGERLLVALSTSQDDVRALLAPEIEIENLTFKSKPCRRALGKQKKVSGKLRDRLAECLLDLEHGPKKGEAGWTAGSLGTTGAALYSPGATWFILGIDSDPSGTTSISRIEQHKVTLARTRGPRALVDERPVMVQWKDLEPLGGSGKLTVRPDRATSRALAVSGKRVLGVWKVCVSSAGTVGADRVKLIKSTGYEDYDAAIASAIAAWKFKPYRIDGVAAEVCSAFTLIYSPR